MSWKLVVVGGLVFWIVTFLVAMVTGMIIHEGILEPHYAATEDVWQPALRQDPPDMMAMMPYWITTGILCALVVAAIYACVRPALPLPGWKRGLYYGLILFGLHACTIIGYSGLFHLPNAIWIWWAIDGLIIYTIGGIALGIVAEKVAPEPTLLT